MITHTTTYWQRAACFIAAIVVLVASTFSQNAIAQLRPNLGTANTYALFTGSGSITSTGISILTGDIGWNTGGPLSGFPPSTYSGNYNHGNGATAQALSDLGAAQTADGLVACGTVIGVGIVDGQSFDPGKYCSGGASTTSGTITFNAHGNGNAIFIVDIGGSLSANAGTHIVLANNARAANIYWFINGAVAVADGSSFTGTIIANGAIHFYGTASLNGRALSSPGGAISIVSSHMSIPTDSGTANNLTVTKPALRDSIRGGMLNDTIRWSGSGIARVKTLQYSLDSGVTWTTIATITNDSLAYLWHVPDTTSTKALVRVTDTSNLRGVSGLFTITSSKIVVIHPMLAEIVTGGTPNYQITWSGVGLTPRKIFEYSLDSGLTWKKIDTISSNLFTHTWHVPDTSSTKAMLRITDSNGITGISGKFTIGSSSIIVTHPALAEIITGGTPSYQITWTGSGLTPRKIFQYSLDSGLTWKTIDTISTALFTHTWHVPDTGSTRAMVRITDSNGMTGKSGLFTIRSSKIIVLRPATNESIIGGTANYQITWSGAGLSTQKTFDYSLDGGVTWKTIGVLNADVFTYLWNVPDTVAARAQVRITDKNGVTGMSGLFSILSSKAPLILVTHPAAGETLAGGMAAYQITWTGAKIATQKTFEYSLDAGVSWTTIGILNADVFTYPWNVPDTTISNRALVRITDKNGLIGMSGLFSILSSKTPMIVVTHPSAGEHIAGGTPGYQITWIGTSIANKKTFELSLDNGLTWSLIGVMHSDVFTYGWNVPDTASTTAVVRITDSTGLTAESGVFTILSSKTPAIVVTRPSAGETLSGGTVYQITWTGSLIDPQKTITLSLDNGATWTTIGTLNADVFSFTWKVPDTSSSQAFVQVTDKNGVTGMSGMFAIKSSKSGASVSSEAAANGYSVSNYPNPVSGQTTISFTLPVRGEVTLIVTDNLGREISTSTQSFESGMHTIPFNTIGLDRGIYNYFLIVGAIRLNGRMNVIR